MISTVLIILTIVIAILLILISIYTLILYIHPDDKPWGSAIYCKILVVIGLIFCWSQALLLPLDVANGQLVGFAIGTSGGFNMYRLWQIVYFSIFALVTFLIPFAIFFYESDQDRPFCYKIATSLVFTIISLGIVLGIILISSTFFNHVNLPIPIISIDVLSSSNSNDTSLIDITSLAFSKADSTIKISPSLIIYIFAWMSFLGWIFLILFAGAGLFSLPFDLIRKFYLRPQPRTSQQMKQTKKDLLNQIKNLQQVCSQLKMQQGKISRNIQDGWFARFQKKRSIKGSYSRLTAKFDILQQEFELFQLQLEYFDANPLIPIAQLFVGFIFLFIAAVWTYQLIASYLSSKSIKFLEINHLLFYLQSNNLSFIATIIFAFMSIYLIWAVQKGNINYGVQIPFLFKFHPMKVNQTWMNSFLFNIILMLVASIGITQLCVSCFPAYVQNTSINDMFGTQLNYMDFFKGIYNKKILQLIFVVWSLVNLLVSLIKFALPDKYTREVEAIRNKRKRSCC